MMKSTFFAAPHHAKAIDLVLLFIRLVCGLAFVIIGWGKIQNPFQWMGEESGFPGILQALAALSEFGGGILLILGLLTRLAALGIGITMVVAVYMHAVVFGDPFVNMTGGGSYQQAASYFLFALLLLIMGPGRYSLDRQFFGTAGQRRDDFRVMHE